MSYSAREVASLACLIEDYEERTISVKFVYRGRNKKVVSLPVFREGSHEEFLCLIQNIDNWMEDYESKQEIHIHQANETFVDCLKDHARDSWISILKDNPKNKTLQSWQEHLPTYAEDSLPEEAARKQIKYLQDTKNSKKFSIGKWI